MEIKPNIFLRELPDGKRQIIALPDGYDDIKGNWEMMSKIGGLTICTPNVDVIAVVLEAYYDNLFMNGKGKTEEGLKAKSQYEDYTGRKWTGGFFIKRSS